MGKYYFLYKENDTDDRDCVKYIEINRLGKLECDHYFPSINIVGANFSIGLPRINAKDMENITTVLTLEDFQELTNYNDELQNLGHGITHGDERYQRGIILYDSIRPVIEKLMSNENEELFERVQEEEREFLKEEYSLNDDEVAEIFDNYTLEYSDRGIVCCIWDSIEDASEEEAWELGYVKKGQERYFNYDVFGQDMLYDSETYHELLNDRVVRYNL